MFRKTNIFRLLILSFLFMFLTQINLINFAAVKSRAPIATNVSISGVLEGGQTLTGNYTYSDANGDLEGVSTYRWLTSASQLGTYIAIPSATSKTYTLTSTDANKYIKFEVTPVAKTGSLLKGTAVKSSALGPIKTPVVITPDPTPTPTDKKIVLGFATKYYSTDVSSLNSMKTNTKSLDEVSTVTYTADALGNLTGTVPQDQIDYAKLNNIKTIALVSNADSSGFNGTIGKSIVENATYKQTFINNLLNAVKNNGYAGVNVDFESLPASCRDNYSLFIKDIRDALAPLGYLVTVSVPAKTIDSTTYSWTYAYDYKTIGTYADQVLIMSYDEHGSWAEPGPVASIGWVTNVANYAETVIAKNKILLGVAAYGYDWASTGNTAVSINKVYSLLATYGGSIQMNSVSKTPYYNYTVNGVAHTIWFENAASLAYKLDLVNQHGLAGIGIWRLGLENSAYWTTINTKFNR